MFAPGIVEFAPDGFSSSFKIVEISRTVCSGMVGEVPPMDRKGRSGAGESLLDRENAPCVRACRGKGVDESGLVSAGRIGARLAGDARIRIVGDDRNDAKSAHRPLLAPAD